MRITQVGYTYVMRERVVQTKCYVTMIIEIAIESRWRIWQLQLDWANVLRICYAKLTNYNYTKNTIYK